MSWSRFLLAVLFYLHQNAFFGWHLEPASVGELLADGVTVLLFSLSFAARRPPDVSVNVSGVEPSERWPR